MHSNLVPQEPCLDVERGIAAMGSASALRLVLQVAYTSLQQDLSVIAQALAAGDMQPAGERLHGIRGICHCLPVKRWPTASCFWSAVAVLSRPTP